MVNQREMNRKGIWKMREITLRFLAEGRVGDESGRSGSEDSSKS